MWNVTLHSCTPLMTVLLLLAAVRVTLLGVIAHSHVRSLLLLLCGQACLLLDLHQVKYDHQHIQDAHINATM